MMSLIRRNLVFEKHGGSELLYKKSVTNKDVLTLTAPAADGSASKLFLPSYKVWIKPGIFILYQGGTRGGDVGRVVSFHETSVVGEVLISIQNCVCDNSNSLLSMHCQRWRICDDDDLVEITISNEDDLGIELYPMQCDFLSEKHFYSCPLMVLALPC
jgi:hypothetical protein